MNAILFGLGLALLYLCGTYSGYYRATENSISWLFLAVAMVISYLIGVKWGPEDE